MDTLAHTILGGGRMIYHQSPGLRLYHGDVLAELATLPDESVDCAVTSPPYWGLRDYGLGEWVGGDEDCEHQDAVLGNNRNFVDREGRGSNNSSLESGDCQKCAAWSMYSVKSGVC